MPPLKYQPLTDYLAAQSPETTSVTLTLPEVEALVGEPLLLMAGTATWSGNARGYRQAATWLGVGWRVSQVQMRQSPRRISFERVLRDSTAPVRD